MKDTIIRKHILDLIHRKPGTSFMEIEKMFEQEGITYKGEEALSIRDDSNIIIWNGWNTKLVDVFVDLVSEGLILMKPVNPVLYMVDGTDEPIFKLPLPEELHINYNKPHWLPVMFNEV